MTESVAFELSYKKKDLILTADRQRFVALTEEIASEDPDDSRAKQIVRRLRAKGCSYRQIERDLGVSMGSVAVTLSGTQVRPGKIDEWSPAPRRLSAEEHEDILVGLSRGESMSSIARQLSHAPSTVTREVAANGGIANYGAWQARCRARQAVRRPKRAKLDHPRLIAQVTAWLEELWSPQEISGRLRLKFPDDPMMQVSHETIYQSLFVQGRGELRRALSRCLRSGRAQRRPQGRIETRGRIPGMVMISERPQEIEDRAIPGHSEGALIIGKNGDSAVGTLVERSSRYVMLLHLPDGRFPYPWTRRCAGRYTSCPRSFPDGRVGSGQRDASTRRLHRRHRDPDLLL